MYKKGSFKPFEKKVWLSSPTMHGEELKYITDAYESNWMSTVGENINEVERLVKEKIGVKYAVALSTGTSTLHLAMKLAGEKIYGNHGIGEGALRGKKVFCSDLTFDATVNPVVYEGGEPVFIDTEYSSWNMDPEALERAFRLFPDVKLIDIVHLYGTPARIDEIRKIADEHGALIVEDAAESFGASFKGEQTGKFGDMNCISFNGNKIITGSAGGCFLTDNEEDAVKIRKWSNQSREPADWYQHRELGYNYRMSNVIAGVIRGQMGHLEEHIEQKKRIYLRYKEGFKDIPVTMNPIPDDVEPNYWLSCILIDKEAFCKHYRTDEKAGYWPEHGKSCPTEIIEALEEANAEPRPIWKPMHMQPIYMSNDFVVSKKEGEDDSLGFDAGRDIFQRGLCLPSDNKMTEEEQDRVIEIVKACFD